MVKLNNEPRVYSGHRFRLCIHHSGFTMWSNWLLEALQDHYVCERVTKFLPMNVHLYVYLPIYVVDTHSKKESRCSLTSDQSIFN